MHNRASKSPACPPRVFPAPVAVTRLGFEGVDGRVRRPPLRRGRLEVAPDRADHGRTTCILGLADTAAFAAAPTLGSSAGGVLLGAVGGDAGAEPGLP